MATFCGASPLSLVAAVAQAQADFETWRAQNFGLTIKGAHSTQSVTLIPRNAHADGALFYHTFTITIWFE